MTPSVSCMCPTYGRTSLLEESIESFLRQDYPGDKELIIVNDLPAQTLRLHEDYPNIKVVNLPERCRTLGHKRNEVANHTTKDLIITWGDDDIHLPSRISANVATWAEGKYVTEGSYYFQCHPNFSLKRSGLCGPFLMKRQDFFDLGGIPDEDVGEDQSFLKLVRGKLEVVATSKTTFVYRWTTGRYHVSQHGFNNGAWGKVATSVISAIIRGEEPSGDVILTPCWREDYEALAAAANE